MKVTATDQWGAAMIAVGCCCFIWVWWLNNKCLALWAQLLNHSKPFFNVRSATLVSVVIFWLGICVGGALLAAGLRRIRRIRAHSVMTLLDWGLNVFVPTGVTLTAYTITARAVQQKPFILSDVIVLLLIFGVLMFQTAARGSRDI